MLTVKGSEVCCEDRIEIGENFVVLAGWNECEEYPKFKPKAGSSLVGLL